MGRNEKPKNNFIDILSKISVIIGFLITLISFIFDLQKWIQDIITFRIITIICFLFFTFSSFWFIIKVKKIKSILRQIFLLIIYFISAFFYIWLGSWIINSNEKSIIIDNMDGVSSWGIGFDNKGSVIKTDIIEDKKKNHTMEISYTIKKDGYVEVAKQISSDQLNNIKSIGLLYKGSGANNSIELKLIYKVDQFGKNAIFSYIWNQATNVTDWTLIKVPLNSFICWVDTGCEQGEKVDTNKVYKINIAISNKQMDTPGTGILILDMIFGYTN